jgi:hypothetical protein
MLGTYAAKRSTRGDLEGNLGSPLSALNLIHESDGVYHFRQGPQPSLPAEIFIAAVLQYWKDVQPEANTISIENVLHRDGSPGRIFKITENRAFDLLTEAESWSSAPFAYRDSAGHRQLFRQDQEITADAVLKRYFESARERVLA